jgi:hypothetical protein
MCSGGISNSPESLKLVLKSNISTNLCWFWFGPQQPAQKTTPKTKMQKDKTKIQHACTCWHTPDNTKDSYTLKKEPNTTRQWNQTHNQALHTTPLRTQKSTPAQQASTATIYELLTLKPMDPAITRAWAPFSQGIS